MSRYKMYNGSTSHIYEELDETLAGCLEAEFEFDYGITEYIPAQVYGPPENCYPAEGGNVEDLFATVAKIKFNMNNGKDGYTVTLKGNEADAFFQYLCAINSNYLETIEEQCRQEASEAEEQYMYDDE